MPTHRRLGAAPLAALATLAASLAHAGDAACEASATQKALAGPARAGFVKQCEADAVLLACDTQAVDRKLVDAARARYIDKCIAEAATKGAGPTCDAQVAEKKLTGPAKASFLKKCVVGRSGGAPG